MSTSLRPPPELTGYEYLQPLGSGGFADVYLYKQRLPEQAVAVKVLHQSVDDKVVQERFEAEANLMAAVSHPFIVKIHNADIAPDGRPFLVMTYYPRGSYAERVRQGRVSVQEALRVGIQIACAVDTAHARNVFHNDIKPSNILLDSFRLPGLTDFGISAVAVPGAEARALGVSIGYTAPEVLLEDLPSTPTADVYGLAATLYTLLAGHSPAQRPGMDNSPPALLRRIEHEDPPPLVREGVPVSAQNLLRQALARQPAQRPASALAFARSLQAVEQELRLPVTELAVVTEEHTEGRWKLPGTDDDQTKYRRPLVLPDPGVSVQPAARDHPQPSVSIPRVSSPRFDSPSTDTSARHPAASTPLPPADATAARPVRPPIDEPQPPAEVPSVAPPRRTGRRWMIVAAVACAGILAAGAAVLATGRGESSRPTVVEQPVPAAADASDIGGLAGPLLAPTDVTTAWVGSDVFEVHWRPPATAVEAYRVTRTDLAEGPGRIQTVTEPGVRFTGVPPGVVPCVEIESLRGGRISQSHSPTVCGSAR